MNKVITINLNGRAYSLEEAGYDALRNYLDQAAAKLQDNPDKDEIMADFEAAVAEKCDARLSGRKNVMSAAEVEAIIAAMGPVDAGGAEAEAEAAAGAGASAETATGGAGADGAAADASSSKASSENKSAGPKRLFRLSQGEWIMGVCTGLAAYFNLDVTVVRVIFVLLIALTHGFGVLAYVILMIVMPVARTDEQMAQARGAAPFNAHDFIEQAKARYAEFQKMHAHPPHPPHPADQHDKEAWRKWRQDMKEWKRQLKHDARAEGERARSGAKDWADHLKEDVWQSWQKSPAAAAVGAAGTAGTGFFRFLMGLVIAGLTVLWVFALWSFLRGGTILGYAFVMSGGGAAGAGAVAGIGQGHPSQWLVVIFLCALFYILVLPFRLLMRNARPVRWSRYSFFNDLMQSIFFVLAIYLAIYIGRELFPVVNEAWSTVAGYVGSVIR